MRDQIPPSAPKPPRRKTRLAATAGLTLVVAWLLAAYIAVPEYWSVRDLGVALPSDMLTRTVQGIPGDPINVGLAGTRTDLIQAFAAAGWSPADPVTWRTAVEIGLSIVLDRPYRDAPVSTLLFDGRPQDMAFERLVGTSADQRHHVRFWTPTADVQPADGIWWGAVSFDRGVGFSHDTGQVTHHIGPDIDAERDALIADIKASGWLASSRLIRGIGATTSGRNGGGDPYVTDGQAALGELRQP